MRQVGDHGTRQPAGSAGVRGSGHPQQIPQPVWSLHGLQGRAALYVQNLFLLTFYFRRLFNSFNIIASSYVVYACAVYKH